MKKISILFCLSFAFIVLQPAYGQDFDNDIFVTDGCYFLSPDEIDRLRVRIDKYQIYGIFADRDKVVIRPVRGLHLEIGNIKEKVHTAVPENIKVRKKYMRNKLSGSTIKYVRLRSYPQPLVFVHLPRYTAGEQPAIVGGRTELAINGNNLFLFEGSTYTIYHSAKLHPNDYPSDIRIILRRMDTAQEQLLSERNNMRSTRSYLVFAGDLDGDGKLDLILDESPRAHHGHLKLYLSTFAADGDLVGLAAEECNTEDPPFEKLMN